MGKINSLIVFVLESICFFLLRIENEYINSELECDILVLLLDIFIFIDDVFFFGLFDFLSCNMRKNILS